MKSVVLLAAALSATTAAAAVPPVETTVERGSVLLFPYVVVEAGRSTTVIRITNDATGAVRIVCQFVASDRHRNGTRFTLGKRGTFWADAQTGQASTPGLNPFPRADTKGWLACFAVDSAEATQIRWNFLRGSATILDYVSGTAVEYAAVPLRALAANPGPSGVIRLNGTTYDACPSTLSVPFEPPGSPGDGGVIQGHRVAFLACNLDTRQNDQSSIREYLYAFSARRTAPARGGANVSDCRDEWFDTTLLDLPQGEGNAIFTTAFLGDTGSYSVSATSLVPSGGCASPLRSRAGLVGVHLTDVSVVPGPPSAQTQVRTFKGKGTAAGFLNWDPQP
jgi:hypothetical protein